MKALILVATIPLLLTGCTTEWQKRIEKQQEEQANKLTAIENRLNDNINSTQPLIKEQNARLEGLEKKLDVIQKALAPVNLAGKWKMGGPYKVGQPCEIIQSENSLIFVNEGGGRADGTFEGNKTVVAVGWDGLKGDITENSSRINWRNGTWWIRENQYRTTGWTSSEVAADDSAEGQLRSQGKHWTRSTDRITAGTYVQDILEGRQGQPKGRGAIGRVTSIVNGDSGAPVAMVDFGRDYIVGIFLSELTLVTVVPE
jgi:hypothetical protein